MNCPALLAAVTSSKVNFKIPIIQKYKSNLNGERLKANRHVIP
jgi:hypothetical protein